jgi:hypothetical protein
MPKIKIYLDTNRAKGFPISEKNRKRSFLYKLLRKIW